MPEEQWRRISDWPDYEVSDCGRVRRGSHIKSHYFDRKGYPKVKLWNRQVSKGFLIHRLVAIHFIGPIPAGHICRHMDGDKSNIRVGNLAYGTPTQNEADKKLHGTDGTGERHPAAKLTEAQIIEIRSMFKPHSREFGGVVLAKRYGVTQALISAIVCRRIWKHVA